MAANRITVQLNKLRYSPTTFTVTATSNFSRSNTMIFSAGGSTGLPAFRRSVTDANLGKPCMGWQGRLISRRFH